MYDSVEKVEAISSKEDFIKFAEWLLEDFEKNPGEWENKTLVSYLRALSSCTEDIEGFYKNLNLQLPKNIEWKVFAHILMAAKMYE